MWFFGREFTSTEPRQSRLSLAYCLRSGLIVWPGFSRIDHSCVARPIFERQCRAGVLDVLTSQEVMTNHSTTLRLAGLLVAASMFCAVMPTEGQEAKPVSPANLPGKGLAQHDFRSEERR